MGLENQKGIEDNPKNINEDQNKTSKKLLENLDGKKQIKDLTDDEVDAIFDSYTPEELSKMFDNAREYASQIRVKDPVGFHVKNPTFEQMNVIYGPKKY